MFCMDCGKFLPDGARFCAFCGKPQPQLSGNPPAPPAYTEQPQPSGNPPAPPAYTEPPQPVQTSGGLLDDFCWDEMPPVMGCSEKQGEMVYAPGWGVYFIRDNNLVYFCQADHKVRQITRTRSGQLRGLNYWNGEVFYWVDGDEGINLFAVKVGSHEKRAVRVKPAGETKDEYLDVDQSSFYIQNGIGYGIAQGHPRHSYLYVLDMNTERYQLKELPDLRTQELPEDWKKEHHPMFKEEYSEKWNFSGIWSGLYIHGQYGYTSIGSYIPFIVRFSLEDPSRFTHMPVGCARVIKERGMISEYDGDSSGHRLLLGKDESRISLDRIFITEFMRDGSMKAWKPVNLKTKSGVIETDGWWRAGDRYMVQNLMLNLKTLQMSWLPFEVWADDFLEVDGGVYVYNNAELYYLPGNFDEVIKSEEDLKRYIVASWSD